MTTTFTATSTNPAVEVRRSFAWSRWFARDKGALLAATPAVPKYVPGNISTWDQLDRPVCLEVGPDGNDLYLFGPMRSAPGWWNAASIHWNQEHSVAR